MKAYDNKAQGPTPRISLPLHVPRYDPDEPAGLRPAVLHPAAAASFVDTLRHRLRSVLCIIGFRSTRRGQDEFPGYTNDYLYHFAQTFPLTRPRSVADGALRWLETDPRPGVEVDLQQVALADDPRELARAWKRLEEAFGITAEDEDWLRARKWLSDIHAPCPLMARHGWRMDAETFGRMERLPCTAVGMWLFPLEALKKPTIIQRFVLIYRLLGRG
ncbi:hypothetical protein N658DRAFT_507219 [Parathielavia hyrcaniae]|uniref:Uncharacterized protein n=1 Tax=Parathielavia hyrcaniae TaxID=113614 RepID=A0AAN6Q5P2_9PEZI|nr:hypothetical protein N658DRAFT_507219 [Parathielavia hyrcaniae]